MNVIIKFITDNIKIIIIALAALIIIITGAVALSLAFGGETVRSLGINEIQGTVVIIRGEKQFYANKKTPLKSGDMINTDETSTIRLCLDNNKYILIEPETSAYIYYTQVSDSGEISVNVAKGAVTCQLNKALKKKESFKVKTPNTAISVRGTVFRTEFSLEDTYMGYNDVMITHVQNFDGSVMLQLYNTDSEKVDEQMLLTERTSAELVSCSEFAQYGYLNYDIDMYALDELTIKELIRINGEHSLAYTLDELNTAFKAILRRKSDETSTVTSYETSETSSETTSTSALQTTATAEEKTTTAETTTSQTEFHTLATTMQTHIYTTYPGPKWWEMSNSNQDEDTYENNVTTVP